MYLNNGSDIVNKDVSLIQKLKMQLSIQVFFI